nr:MAG TPA: hypothetical protein [Caudoviricetes sp.]
MQGFFDSASGYFNVHSVLPLYSHYSYCAKKDPILTSF